MFRRTLATLLAPSLACLTATAQHSSDTAATWPPEDAASRFLALSPQPADPMLAWSLVDARSGEVVEPSFANEADFVLVEGTDEWMLRGDASDLATLTGAAASNLGFLRKKPALRRALVPFTSTYDKAFQRFAPEPLLHEDGHRLVFVEQGDVWQGRFDWTTGEIAERKQLTTTGVFSGKQPVLWSGDRVFLWCAFDPARPFVRLDLESGEVEEVDWLNFTPLGTAPPRMPSFTTDPLGTVAIAGVADWVQLVDLGDGRVLRVPILHEDGSAAEFDGSFGHPDHLHWIDDTTAVAFGLQAHARLDLRTASVVVRPWEGTLDGLVEGDGLVRFEARLPDSATALMSWRVERGPTRHFLFDLDSHEVRLMPEELEPAFERPFDHVPTWLDASRLVWSVPQGGLDQMGLWLFDRDTGETRRLASMPPHRQVLAFPEHGHLIVNCLLREGSGESYAAYTVKLDGSGAEMLSGTWSDVRSLPTDRVAIGFGEEACACWSASPGASPLPEEPRDAPLVGLAAVLDSVREDPLDVQELAVSAFEAIAANHSLREFYSPGLAVRAVIDVARAERAELVEGARARQQEGYEEITEGTNARKAASIRAQMQEDADVLAGNLPAFNLSALMLRADFSTCLDREKAYRFGYDAAMAQLERGFQGTTPEDHPELADKVGEKVVAFCMRSKQTVQSRSIHGQIFNFLREAKQGR